MNILDAEKVADGDKFIPCKGSMTRSSALRESVGDDFYERMESSGMERDIPFRLRGYYQDKVLHLRDPAWCKMAEIQLNLNYGV